METLKNVIDPELGLSIVDMGLIYEVNVEGKQVNVKMTLTAPGCPLASFIAHDAERNVKKMEGVEEAVVEVVFDPPWSPDMMSDKAKNLLGYKG